jgi:hypothetical protein
MNSLAVMRRFPGDFDGALSLQRDATGRLKTLVGVRRPVTLTSMILLAAVRRLIARVSYDATACEVTIQFRAASRNAVTQAPNEISYKLRRRLHAAARRSARCPRSRSLRRSPALHA